MIKKVLVIDDDDDIREVIIECFTNMTEDEGIFDIDEAVNGAQGIEKLEQQEYDLVVIDYKMPYFNGNQVISAFRAKDTFKTPFLMVSGFLDDIDLLDSDPNVFYLAKPFSTRDFIQNVKTLLKFD